MIRLIKLILRFRGLEIRGFHNIHISDSDNPKIIEFLGLASKSYYLKLYKQVCNLRTIKPNVFEDEIINTEVFNSDNQQLVSEFAHFNFGNRHYSRNLLNSVYKMMIQNKYKDYNQFWDEGLIKSNLELIENLIIKNPIYLKKLLAKHKIIILIPPFDIVLSRYARRLKIKELSNEMIANLEEKKRIYEVIYLFLKENGISHLYIEDVDTHVTLSKIVEYLE